MTEILLQKFVDEDGRETMSFNIVSKWLKENVRLSAYFATDGGTGRTSFVKSVDKKRSLIYTSNGHTYKVVGITSDAKFVLILDIVNQTTGETADSSEVSRITDWITKGDSVKAIFYSPEHENQITSSIKKYDYSKRVFTTDLDNTYYF